MNPTIRLLFDECIGFPMMQQLARMIGECPHNVSFHHILETQLEGVKDRIWIPLLARDRWIVISTDRARRGGSVKGGNLPALCLEYGITHVLLSTAVHRMKLQEKIKAIWTVWDDVVKTVAPAPAGSRFVLRVAGDSFALESRQATRRATR